MIVELLIWGLKILAIVVVYNGMQRALKMAPAREQRFAMYIAGMFVGALVALTSVPFECLR